MKSIGLVYENRVSHYEYTKKRQDVIAMRDNYLEWIEGYRQDGYLILYQDESWVFKNLAPTKVWRNTNIPLEEEVYKVPSGKGERSILSHIASTETELLEGCLLLFRR